MVIRGLPNWLLQRYSLLWKAFGDKEFDYDMAAEVLKEKRERLVSAVLSDIKKYEWLTLRMDPKDSRKRLYTLKDPEKAICEVTE